MKIKVYIITYKKNDVLNNNLKTLWESITNPENIEVNILSNHPDIFIEDENKRENLKIIFNTTRMTHAWGYLSRDWNFCILDCFKTWQNPNNIDWLVMAQNDVTWVKGWDEWLIKNKDFDFISQPRGDQAMALNIDAVKKVGFFDERFTTLHCQEVDYFIRATYRLRGRCSINDDHEVAKLSFNSVGNVITETSFSGFNYEDETFHNIKNMDESINFINYKYEEYVFKNDINNLNKHIKNREINWYPFFWDEYEPIKETFLKEYYDVYSKPIKFKGFRKIISLLIPSKKLRKKVRGQL